ncbi:hypothetical protein, partial [Thiohalocapsa sp.]|uniref:hypothetical protein n=1 Tax=Thiohalocapsa sp. TaxID=2497641 RepID=UPI0025F2E287
CVVFRGAVFRTDSSGIAHLFFFDRAVLTWCSNSEVVIDRFVDDPADDPGELGISAARGVLRFVGGKLSKDGRASIETPLGNLGIRGGIALIESNGTSGDTIAVLIYGELLMARHRSSGVTQRINAQGHGVRLTPDGNIEPFGPITPQRPEALLTALSSPGSGPSLPPLPLPADFDGWLRDLAAQNTIQDKRDEERPYPFLVPAEQDSVQS